MAIGLVGRKVGMTRVFTTAGETVPVTVIEVLPNRVTQVKTGEKDGYRAVQMAYGARRPQLLTKAVAGHYAKATGLEALFGYLYLNGAQERARELFEAITAGKEEAKQN